MKRVPELDPGFVPAVMWNRAFVAYAKANGGSPYGICVERPDGSRSTFRTWIQRNEGVGRELNGLYLERLVKFLLWSRGGMRVLLGGDREAGEHIRTVYSAKGERVFDFDYMGQRVWGSPMTFECTSYGAILESKESALHLGRHLGGCRIGFDLGGSDRKCAAVMDGKVLFTEEVGWDPYFQADPSYHLEGIRDTLRRAAAHLPRVDAIGGSAAGIYVNSEVRAASLFRGVSPEDFNSHIRGLFRTLQKEWSGIPFEVVNDGEVTALAGSMSMGENGVLGISMGTSLAAGYVTQEGCITNWLNELAFVPVDYRENGPVDEWSGDQGCGVQYFSQQGVARLAPLAGLHYPVEMPLPERLVEVQEAMKTGDERAAAIYRTIGHCFGYSIAHYRDFYDFNNLLILGRVTSGVGGELLLEAAGEVLDEEFPEVRGVIRLRTPNEQDKRHGQAVAAASLPEIPPGASPWLPPAQPTKDAP